MKSELNIKSEKLLAVQEENEKMRVQITGLEETCTKLAGNQNMNERIKYMQKLKQDHNSLQQEKERVERELYRYKRRYGDLSRAANDFCHLESQVDKLQHNEQELLATVTSLLGHVGDQIHIEITGETLQERVIKATEELTKFAAERVRLAKELGDSAKNNQHLQQQLITKNEYL